MYKELIKKVLDNAEMNNLKQVIQYLKDLQIISQNIRVEEVKGKDGKVKAVEYLGMNIQSGNELYEILKPLLEKLPSKEEKLKELRETVKIGTEFTFRDDNMNFSMEDLEMSINSKVEVAGKKLIAYTDAIFARCNKAILDNGLECEGKKFFIKSIESVKADKKYKDSKSYNAVKFHIKFCYKDNNDNELYKTHELKINFDLDPNCIELQIEPVTYAFFNECKGFIKEILFNTTKNLVIEVDKHQVKFDLNPDQDPKKGGGGHISLDFKTAFCGQVFFLRNFLVLYENAVNENAGSVLGECKDFDNAPFVHEVGEFQSFKRLMETTCRNLGFTAEKFVDDMHQTVYKGITTTLCDMGVKDKDAIHYQAVNLENVLNADESLRRVEMRRFNAQKDVDELLRELDALFELIVESGTLESLELKS